MKTALVGYTGFVGSNLAAAHGFTGLYNSKNIDQAADTRPDLLVYAGVRAEKFLANQMPEKDLKVVREAFDNIQRIRPRRLVLISTIDVYKNPVEVDEDSLIETEGLHPYGYNRYLLEQWVREAYPDALIVRLPGLYGKNIRKNFIYDYIHVIPSMLKEEKLLQLEAAEAGLKSFYEKQDNGFYKCRSLSEEEGEALRAYFKRAGFSAMNFTDSRGIFQFYPLSRLWGHVETALKQDLRLLNLATEPLKVAEIYQYFTGRDFVNEIAQEPPCYDYRTKYAGMLGGAEGYLLRRDFLLKDLKQFVEEETGYTRR